MVLKITMKPECLGIDVFAWPLHIIFLYPDANR